MDVSNDTNTDSKYKVSGGGGAVPMPKGRWLSLKARKKIKHSPKPPGPWTVSFSVNGHEFVGKADTANAQVKLTKTKGQFHVAVCEVF